jgi:hypothetical protein
LGAQLIKRAVAVLTQPSTCKTHGGDDVAGPAVVQPASATASDRTSNRGVVFMKRISPAKGANQAAQYHALAFSQTNLARFYGALWPRIGDHQKVLVRSLSLLCDTAPAFLREREIRWLSVPLSAILPMKNAPVHRFPRNRAELAKSPKIS